MMLWDGPELRYCPDVFNSNDTMVVRKEGDHVYAGFQSFLLHRSTGYPHTLLLLFPNEDNTWFIQY